MALTAMLIALTAPLDSCGVVSLNGSATNDPTPSGTLVASGAFPSGALVQGTAQIYQQGTNTYVLYMVGMSYPSNISIELIVSIGATTVYTVQPSGNDLKNGSTTAYGAFTTTASGSFTQVQAYNYSTSTVITAASL